MCGHIVGLPILMHYVLYMGIHELCLLSLILQQVGDPLNVLILLLYHLVVEHEGIELHFFILLMVCLVFKNVCLRECRLLQCVKMVDIR